MEWIKLTVEPELRIIPLPRPVHSNGTLQRASGRHRWLGSRQANGPQLRGLYGRLTHFVYLSCREILARWIVQLFGRNATGGK